MKKKKISLKLNKSVVATLNKKEASRVVGGTDPMICGENTNNPDLCLYTIFCPVTHGCGPVTSPNCGTVIETTPYYTCA